MTNINIGNLNGGISTYTNFVGNTDPTDSYSFQLTAPGRLSLSLNGLGSNADLALLNSTGTIIASSLNSGTTAEAINIAGLSTGKYTARVFQVSGETNYNLSLTADYAGDTLATARNLGNLNGISSYRDLVGTTDSKDIYGIDLNANGSLNVLLNGISNDANIQVIQDANNNGLIETGEILRTSANTGTTAESISLTGLAAGKYYVQVYPGAGGDTNYNLTLTADYAGNTLNTARSVTIGATPITYQDYINAADSNDIYQISLSVASSINLKLDGLGANANLQLIKDANNNGIIDIGEVLQTSANTGRISEEINQTGLAAGNYYLRVYPGVTSAATNYRLSLSATALTTPAITGTKWSDRNGNGVRDTGEAGLAGWTIYLDQNLNGQLDTGELSTITDANGNYAFTGLAPGNYTVAEVAQTGWTRTSPGNGESQNTLIPVTDRRDLVFDPVRNLLYMTTSDGDIERYNVATRTLLTAFDIADSLYGADITPDGSYLYIADGQAGATQGFIRKVNLNDGSVTNLTFNLNYDDRPSDIAITSQGTALIRSFGQWGSVRQLNLTTGTISARTDKFSVYGGAQITRSADRSLFFMTQDGISSGDIFTYDAVTDTFSDDLWTNAFLGSNLSAVNRNGSLIALEWGNGISIMDKNLNGIQNLSNLDGGMAFDPGRDILYAASTSADQVIAYNTNTWQELYRLNIGENISSDYYGNTSIPFGTGMMSVSSDGQFLFMSTPSGVRMLNLNFPGTYNVNLTDGQIVNNINFGANAVPVVATNASLTLNEAATANITNSLLNVTDADNSAAQLTYTLKNLPTQGTLRLNGIALNANQTFTQDDINQNRLSYLHNGSETTSDSFSFTLTDGAGNNLSSNTFNITVNPVNDAPILSINDGRIVRQGATVTINSISLQTTDIDNTASQVVYTLNSLPSKGVLKLNNTNLTAGQTFTQDDINNNRISYQHNGIDTTADSFSFNVSDGAVTLSSNTFSITVTASTGIPSIVKDINPGSGSSSPTNLTNVNGNLFFTAYDPLYGAELWQSDGTAAGTILVKDIFTGFGSSSPANFTNVNGILFFTASDNVNGIELWKSDGTAAGTVLVKDINSGLGSSSPANFTNVNGTLFFTANNGINGIELWKSDGTATGTVLVKDINSGLSNSFPGNFTNVNGTLFFTANNGSNGIELWKSDGTAAGTVLVKDINPGLGGSSPSNFTNVNGTLFFTAYDPNYGFELWKSDGTAAGTVLVKDIYAGGGGSLPQNLTNVNGTLYFTAYDGVKGYELWKSNGTASGTVLVKDINSGGGSSSPSNFTNVNGTLYFTASNGVNGYELWKSNGTASGTVMVKDINVGVNSSAPANLINVNGTLYFVAFHPTYGSEIWKSNGTAAGTVLVRDINLGSENSSPANFTNVNGILYFTADDGINRNELWVL